MLGSQNYVTACVIKGRRRTPPVLSHCFAGISDLVIPAWTANIPLTTMAEPMLYDTTIAEHRAATAAFIVSVFKVYKEEIAAGHPAGTTNPQLPSAPAHVSSILRDECYGVARVLAEAASNIREDLPEFASSGILTPSCTQIR